MRRVRKNFRGVSLIELIVSTGIAGFVALVAIEVNRQRNASSLAQERTMQTASQARQFFDLRGKVFRAATEAVIGDAIPPSNVYISSIQITTSNAGIGQFSETLQNQCSGIPRPLPFNLTAAEVDLFNSCLPNCNNVPRISITRTGQANPQTFPAGDGTGLDGHPIGAALCMRINGNASTYRDITMELLTFVRTADDRVKLIPYQATFPRPKQINANSIRVIGTIRE